MKPLGGDLVSFTCCMSKDDGAKLVELVAKFKARGRELNRAVPSISSIVRAGLGLIEKLSPEALEALLLGPKLAEPRRPGRVPGREPRKRRAAPDPPPRPTAPLAPGLPIPRATFVF